MKKTRLLSLFLALLLLSLPLSLSSCNKGSFTLYVNIDGETDKLEIDLGDYGSNPTFYDILKQDDTLEADFDETGEPRLLSVCNVRADAGESYMLLSSNPDQAGPDAHPSVYEDMTFYLLDDLLGVKPQKGTSYLLVLVKVA